MERINISTGLDGFVLVDKITGVGDSYIKGIKNFKNAPVCFGLESLAQLGAFHVRYINSFKRHAFLLKIDSFSAPSNISLIDNSLNGDYLLSGTLDSRSKTAFSYNLEAKTGDKIQIKGKFIFATIEFGSLFKKEILENHYRMVFSCLQSGSKKG